MKAKSIKGKIAEEIQSALRQNMADGFRPTLALVFLSVIAEIKETCFLLSKKNIAISGAITSAEFTEEGTEFIIQIPFG